MRRRSAATIFFSEIHLKTTQVQNEGHAFHIDDTKASRK